eukprot:CAMPEP_0173246646 /NCGR_PEP_ID=MMETSP1142-20121109/17442_1 /TAXON_ID=483371 /ORGANISM="non described non described, Strain CCMP2298" /LENGTH=125 /DNA_ID=CAMNT_0014178911 /DNA_START=899 /DNA_END=1276 /DNA_ORIENTATION=-
MNSKAGSNSNVSSSAHAELVSSCTHNAELCEAAVISSTAFLLHRGDGHLCPYCCLLAVGDVCIEAHDADLAVASHVGLELGHEVQLPFVRGVDTERPVYDSPGITGTSEQLPCVDGKQVYGAHRC